MKKLFSIILIACLAMAVMAVAPVSAANDVVLRGTPTIDGEIDEIYKQSLTIAYSGENNAATLADGHWPAGKVTTYALYDASYLYLATEVVDDDVVSAGDSFVYENINPYGNDVVEYRLDLGGSAANSMDTFMKIGIDAYGKRAYSPADMGISIDVDTLEYDTTITETGYIIEVKIPHDTRAGDDLIGTGKLGLKVWVFDLAAEHAGVEAPQDGVHFYMYSEDIAGEGSGNRVFYNLSDEKAEAPSAGNDDTTPKADDTTPKADDTTPKADDTTPKADDTTPKADDTTPKAPTTDDKNPDTFDPAVIAVVLTAASGAAFVVASKKRH